MPLVPQLVDVPFEGGLDTNREKKRVIPGKLLELENARFRGGVIDFRPGSSTLSNGVVGGGTLFEATAVASVGNELLRWTSTGIYGRATATSAPWVLRAPEVEARPLAFSLENAVSRPQSTEGFDFAAAGGVAVYVWTELTGPILNNRAILATVVDLATGTRFQEATVLATETSTTLYRTGVRAVACGSTILVAYGTVGSATTSTSIKVRPLNTASPGTFGTEVTAVSGVGFTNVTKPFLFDLADVTDNRFTGAVLSYSYGATPATAVRTLYIGSDGTVQSPIFAGTSNWDVTFASSPKNLRIFMASNRNLQLLACVDTEALVAVNTEVLDDPLGPNLLGSTTTGFIFATAVELADGNSFRCWLQPDQFATDQRLCTAVWETGDAALSEAVGTWRYRVQLGGDAFTLGSKRLVPILYTEPEPAVEGEPGIQPTFFLADDTGEVVARVLPGETGGPLRVSSYRLASCSVSGTSASLLVPKRIRPEFSTSDGALDDISVVGLVRMDVEFANPAALGKLEEEGCLHVGGACPSYYDGVSWVEDGFHLFPDSVGVSEHGAGGGIGAGSYSWVVCYEWQDAGGRLHRSTPSIPVASSFGAGGKAVDVTVPYLHLTRKPGVRIAVYRTLAGGTVYHRVTRSSLARVQPDGGEAPGPTITIVDDAADGDIEANEILYSTGPDGTTLGGELWHKPPPAYSAIFRHQDYLFVNRMEAPHSFAYSLPVLAGEGTAWADELSYTVPATDGTLVAFGAVDEKLVLFSERTAFAIFGQGPTRDGQGNGFTEPQRLTGSQGCVNGRSVVSTVDGLFFQATTGFHLLTRSLETAPAGAAVDAYANYTVARALEVPSAKEVRFYTENGRTLVWSYEWKQWGTWTLQPANDACLLGGVAYFAASGNVRYEDSSTFEEAGQTLRAIIGTGWLRWASFKGLQRVWRLFLEGESEPSVRLKVEVFVDDKPSVVESVEQVLLGSGEEGGPPEFSVSHHLTRQLCKSLRLRFTLTREPVDPATESSGGRVSLTALSLEFGVHPQAAKRDMRKV